MAASIPAAIRFAYVPEVFRDAIRASAANTPPDRAFRPYRLYHSHANLALSAVHPTGAACRAFHS